MRSLPIASALASLTVVALTVLAAGLLAAPLFAQDGGSADAPAGETVSHEVAEKDLTIQAELATEPTIEAGGQLRVKARLVNTSTTRTHRVVKPGDGSESGWREPHVYWSAETETADGEFEPLERQPIGRCGMYDADWHDEVVRLAPGESIPLSDWLVPPHLEYEFQRAGRVRVRLHYIYSGGRVGKGEALPGTPPVDPGPMEGVEPFELVSGPVEFRVVRPLDVRLANPATIRHDAVRKSSVLFRVRVRNTTDEALVLSPREWYVSFETHRDGGRLAKREDASPPDPKRRPEQVPLAPGEERELFGEDGLLPDIIQLLQAADRREPRMSVVLHLDRTGRRRIRSNWKNVPVRP